MAICLVIFFELLMLDFFLFYQISISAVGAASVFFWFVYVGQCMWLSVSLSPFLSLCVFLFVWLWICFVCVFVWLCVLALFHKVFN
jgi:hypothetical protein